MNASKRMRMFGGGKIFLLTLISIALLVCVTKSEEVATPPSTPGREVKYILVCVFPGGKSHNFVMKDLFDHSLANQSKYEYKYHILVHNWDKNAWPSDGPYVVHGYGDMNLYDLIFNDALDLVRKDPIFGYTKFNKAMLHIYDQFMESNILAELRKFNFELMITDIPNFLTKFLRSELKIKHHSYVTPPSLPNLFYSMFEMNPSYYPTIGSTFSDSMTLPERFTNSVFVIGMKFMFWLFIDEQAGAFKKYGYDVPSEIHVHDSLVMIQFPPGLFYNLSLPPNFIRLNAITPKPPRPIGEIEPNIDAFLNKFKKNVYFSQGTIVKIVDFDKIIEIFNHFKDVGFILSFKKKWVGDDIIAKFPENVLLIGWVQQNDLLGDPRLNAFITHGGTNSVSESIYHFKPMIVLGVTLDQINTASVVKKREVGIVIHDSKDINSDTLIKALEEVLLPEDKNKYTKNCKKYGRILRGNKDPREEYLYWLNYGLDFGYDHLLVKSYREYNMIQLYNYDIIAFALLISLVIYYLLKKLLVCLFCSCKAKNKKDKKKDD